MIPGATFVDDLAPYIERKLFTVNTGHAAAAYFGFEAGLGKISEAMADQDVAADVRAVLDETKELLVAKHGFNRAEQEAYVEKILGRFSNPHLPDTVTRVGRAPLRKLSRHERFIGPAAELAERGIVPEALLGAIAAALRFNDPADAEAVELAKILSASTPDEATEKITACRRTTRSSPPSPPSLRRAKGGRQTAPAQRLAGRRASGDAHAGILGDALSHGALIQTLPHFW